MGRLVTKRMTLVKKNVAERDFVISWRIRRNWTRNVLKRQKQVSKLGHPHKISNTLLFISIWIVSHFLPPFKLSLFREHDPKYTIIAEMNHFLFNILHV